MDSTSSDIPSKPLAKRFGNKAVYIMSSIVSGIFFSLIFVAGDNLPLVYTFNILAKMAHGLADDLLSSVALATRAPILVAPAMNTGMWEAAATQENIAVLKSRGVAFVEPRDAELACGVTGKGCMSGPAEIFAAAKELV